MTCMPCMIGNLIYLLYGLLASAGIALSYKLRRKIAKALRWLHDRR